MPTLKKLLKRRGVVALLGATSLVLTTAGPAAAAQTVKGTGGGTGWEYPSQISDNCPPGLPILGMLPNDRFELLHTGTYTGVNTVGTPIAVYTGDVRVTINIGPHVISPAGVGPDCALPVGPVPIQSALVDGTTANGGKIHCTATSGTYTRVTSAVNFTFTGPCELKGNTGVLTANINAVQTTHVITGTMNPCSVPVPPTEESVPNPECIAGEIANPSEGDPGSHLVTTYAAAGAQAP